MAVLITGRDPFGVRVVCHDTTWSEHIVADHPEMAGNEAWVQQTVEDPLAIYQSEQHPRRRIFHRPYRFNPPLGNAFLRVVVEYRRRGLERRLSGTLVTAFAATGPKQGETLIWPSM